MDCLRKALTFATEWITWIQSVSYLMSLSSAPCNPVLWQVIKSFRCSRCATATGSRAGFCFLWRQLERVFLLYSWDNDDEDNFFFWCHCPMAEKLSNFAQRSSLIPDSLISKDMPLPPLLGGPQWAFNSYQSNSSLYATVLRCASLPVSSMSLHIQLKGWDHSAHYGLRSEAKYKIMGNYPFNRSLTQANVV